MADNLDINKKVKQVRAKSTKKKLVEEKEESNIIVEEVKEEVEIEVEVEEVQDKIEEVKAKVEEVKAKVEEVQNKIEDKIEEAKVEQNIIIDTIVDTIIELVEIPSANESIVQSLALVDESLQIIKTIENEKDKVFEIKSLLNLLILFTVRDEMQDKYGVKLDPHIIDIISTIIKKHPAHFSSIEKSFKKIISDNKIDSSDVPELMELLSGIYKIINELDLNNYELSPSEICGKIIKLIFNIMITEKFIEIDNTQEMVKTFNALVDSSVMLIALSGYGGKIKSKLGCCCC